MVSPAAQVGSPPQAPSPTVPLPGRVLAGVQPLRQPTDALASRADLVAVAFRAQGAHPVAERWVTFLREGNTDTLAVDLAGARCVGFVAVGREAVVDLNLAVSNTAGITIGRDSRGDAHPYVRVCLPGAARIFVSATVARGAGEVAVLTLADPPVVPPALDGILGVRPGGQFAGPRTPRAAVGADPGVLGAVEALRRAIARLPAPTYVPRGEVQSGVLEGQRAAVRSIDLIAGHCYVVLGAGGPGVEDLDLVVGSPDRQPLGHDAAMDARPSVRVCARRNGPHPVEVRMYAGSGEWALGLAEITSTGVALGDDVTGVVRARALEIAGEAARRRMEPSAPPVRGAPWGLNTLAYPIQLRSGRCYMAGAAASETLAPVEMWLADATGAVLASDTGERERAAIYHCARRDERATVTVRTPGGRGEYVYQAFVSRDEER